MNLITPAPWSDYELIDSGDFQKLERFGTFVLARPEPQAIWKKSLSDEEWGRRTNALFRRDRQSPERGDWQTTPDMRDPWYVSFRQGGLNLTFKLALTSFKHVGLFPEQADNWTYIYDKVTEMSSNGSGAVAQPNVLNLFAYTGGASLAARQAGAAVTHVDAVKPVISWARENMDHSELDNIRWVVEDATKFVRREVRRGNRYNGIIMDPPAYGRGPDGEKWVLEEHLGDLLRSCADLLDREDFFFIINLYSLGFSSLILENLIRQTFGQVPNAEWGELFMKDSDQKRLPLGVFYRFASVPLSMSERVDE
ncbi:class I SAM-dependent methyltransferase [Spirosoma utsteinense]|uniref:23S rRNA (Cytosine1962-C5)-methyltransferase n=1 Tax=Spirosoma utsteinense TaxID=2585773 RepID=A0ABR6WAW5_9BACT|nr:class I SAM-dependent methyltransferase [Spirosoma utsteinense]MBC3785772.1 23S rRNA (cytosine1962-C5)-methyltransferase [Spirosoma utsteinense]MBC3793701.1 23S rRNA (cytosine1962-C5)-methyltransferase [Spirosoma utsteinense]